MPFRISFLDSTLVKSMSESSKPISFASQIALTNSGVRGLLKSKSVNSSSLNPNSRNLLRA